MLKFGSWAFLVVLSITGATAQKRHDNFLSEVLEITSFKMNSSLKDVQRDKQIAENLSLFLRMDNEAVYDLKGQPINLPGLKPLDRLAFDTVELTFQNNKLHDVLLHIPNPFNEEILKKTFEQFNSKYGKAVVLEKKYVKVYTWDLGANKLTISASPKFVGILYSSKIMNKQVGWIYSDRKGEGNGTIQLNLPYFEKLLGEKLTVASFEKILPQWQTTGAWNHLQYEFNFATLNLDRPVYFMTYSLKDYNLEIETTDTTSKVINEFSLDNIKSPNVFSQFEKDLAKLHYTVSPKPKYIKRIGYSNHKYSVYLDKENSRISIVNPLKLKLP